MPINNQYFEVIAYPDSLGFTDKFPACFDCNHLKGFYFFHYKDFYTEDTETNGVLHLKGEIKKAHYHMLIDYGQPTTLNHIRNILNSCLGKCRIRILENPEDVIDCWDYPTHEDYPEDVKPHYDESERVVFGGFDITPLRVKHATSGGDDSFEVINIINQNCILELSDLVDYLFRRNEYILLNCVLQKSFFFKSYLDSKRNKFKGRNADYHIISGKLDYNN